MNISGSARSGRVLVSLALLAFASLAWPALVVSKSVAPQVISNNDPVEFTIVVRNDGVDLASNIHVTEQLPAGLMVTPGMSAFVSQGFYTPDSGDWSLGDLAGGVEATMTIPAVLEGADAPLCMVNEAAIEPDSVDPGRERTTAAATVRQVGVERCVNLAIRDALFVVPEPFCSDETSARLDFTISNQGPDAARGVVVTVSQTPAGLPGFEFASGACGGNDPLRCELPDLLPGEVRLLLVASAPFSNPTGYSVTLAISIATTDVDLDAADNVRNLTRTVPITRVAPCPIPNPLGSSSGSGCFIATAAWGQQSDESVVALRWFRDRYLVTNAPGRSFVRWYYRVSPPAAQYIADKPVWRAIVRGGLTPLVVTIQHPGLVLFGLMLLLILVRRRCKGRVARKSSAAVVT